MSYCVSVSGELTIKKGKEGEACAAVLADIKSRNPTYTVPTFDAKSAELPLVSLVNYLADEAFDPCVLDGFLSFTIYELFIHKRHYDSDMLVRALAPFVDDTDIDLTGEDGAHWNWKIQDGVFSEIDGEVLYGDAIKYPAVIEQLLALVYPGGEDALLSVAHASLSCNQQIDIIRKLEAILRPVGPLAGKTPLELLAVLGA